MLIILLVFFLLVVLYLLYLLHALYSIQQQLMFLEKNRTNKELRTDSKNPIIIRIVVSINKILVHNKQTRQKIIEENRQIDQAINNISHDLRTPLAVAAGYTQYLEAERLDEQDRQGTLSNISSNLAIVEQRLEQLLDYNRLNEHRVQLHPICFDLSELVKETLLNMYDSFTKKHFEVKVAIYPALQIIQDKEQTARLLQNLLGNVLVHGDKTAEIKLIKPTDQNIAILEIANEMRESIKAPERLAERFYTEDFSRQKENSGLGLYIVKQLVELQQGQLKIETAAKHFLVRITFKLPASI